MSAPLCLPELRTYSEIVGLGSDPAEISKSELAALLACIDAPTHYARVKRAAYEIHNGYTEITVIIPGKHHPQPGEIIAMTTKESKK